MRRRPSRQRDGAELCGRRAGRPPADSDAACANDTSPLRVSAAPLEKIPLDEIRRVPNPNRPTLNNLPENSRTPVGAERLAEAALRLFHLLARPRLAEDPHEAGAEAEELATRVRERDAAQHHVRAAFRWIDVNARFRGGFAPCRFIDDRDLAPASLIGIADQTAAGNRLRAFDRIHDAAMR